MSYTQDEYTECAIEANKQHKIVKVVDGQLTIQEPVDNRNYAEKRQAEYPPMEDYLDGIVKGNQEQIDKYIADCLAVKAKYPKPSEE